MRGGQPKADPAQHWTCGVNLLIGAQGVIFCMVASNGVKTEGLRGQNEHLVPKNLTVDLFNAVNLVAPWLVI